MEKKNLSSAVHGHIEAMWRAEVNEKPSLKYVNPDSFKVGSVHPVWATVRNSITDNMRAQLKCKLLSGTYTLQGNRAAFNQYTVDATCKLCLAAPETRQHFVAVCMDYSVEREKYKRNSEITQPSLMKWSMTYETQNCSPSSP